MRQIVAAAASTSVAYTEVMRTRLALLFVLVAAWLVIPSAAPFHFELIRSTPAANTTVKMAPTRLQLWFTQVPAAAVSTVTLSQDGKHIAVGKTTIVKDDKSMYAEPAKPLTAGTYTIHWRGAGDDGHVQQGDIVFTVGAK